MSKEKHKWDYGKGFKGSVRGAILHHPDKFDAKCEDPNRLCPYAIFSSMKKKGYESHYKDQESTLKGTPKKKPEYKNEVVNFSEYVKQRDLIEGKKRKKMIGFLNATVDMP
jgi:hypothetical protein